MDKGNRKAGYTVVILEEVVEAEALWLGTSAQKAELIALTRALELSYEKKVNVYTDLRHTFPILHAHSLIWKEKCLLTSNKKNIKHATENFKLPEASQVPFHVSVMHCPWHQKEDA